MVLDDYLLIFEEVAASAEFSSNILYKIFLKMIFCTWLLNFSLLQCFLSNY